MTFARALPIRDLRAKVGNQTGCGGMAVILVDFEPATAHAVDSNESVNRRAGQDVTRQALRLSLTDVW